MNRRAFLAAAVPAACGLATAGCATGSAVRWSRGGRARLFDGVGAGGLPLAPALEAACRLHGEDPARATRLGGERDAAAHGPLRLELSHRLLDGGDLLEATLTVHNDSRDPQRVEAAMLVPAGRPGGADRFEAHVPLTAAGLFADPRFAALGVKKFQKECGVPAGDGPFVAHYLEPMASCPEERETRALLLVPVVDLFSPGRPWRVAFFTASDQPVRFSRGPSEGWRASRTVVVPPGGTFSHRGWLLVHAGGPDTAWRAFHRFGHREDHPAIGWTREFKVHYYDFLSSAEGEKGRRGGGFDADAPYFREFRVGLATQHGYYPTLGDYLHPDRTTWQAMRGDKQGAAEMSFEKMRARIRAARAAGAKAAVYLHPVLFDDATPFFQAMRDSVLVDAEGKPVPYPWQGPDTVGRNWRASLASPEWREHLLRQAGWIMDILRPDALVVDETFAGLGYDHHPNHAGPTSPAAIDFYRKLRALARSFGADRAVFSSDCSMSPFVLWADGECGDHAYPGMLNHPLYTQEPVRYLAALGDKPWRPCAWHFRKMWPSQMSLARQAGAGVGVSNGWLEYTGLARLPAAEKARDIATLSGPGVDATARYPRPEARS